MRYWWTILHWIRRFSKWNVNKVNIFYGIVLILVASCSFRCTLQLYWQCLYLHSVIEWPNLTILKHNIITHYSFCIVSQAPVRTTSRAWARTACGRPTSRALDAESSAARRRGSNQWCDSTRSSCRDQRITRSRRSHLRRATNNRRQTSLRWVRGYPSSHCPRR